MSDRESLSFGDADTMQAGDGRGPGNEHTPHAFRIVKPDPRHPADRVGCYDDHAHDRLSGHDDQLRQLWERVNGTTGADGVSQKQARYEQQLQHFAAEVVEIKAAQKITDGKVDTVNTNVAAVRQAIIERGAGPGVWACVVLACLAFAVMCGAVAYKVTSEANRIEAAR